MKKFPYSGYISILLIVFLIPVFNVKTLFAQSDDCEKIRAGVYHKEAGNPEIVIDRSPGLFPVLNCYAISDYP